MQQPMPPPPQQSPDQGGGMPDPKGVQDLIVGVNDGLGKLASLFAKLPGGAAAAEQMAQVLSGFKGAITDLAKANQPGAEQPGQEAPPAEDAPPAKPIPARGPMPMGPGLMPRQ